MNTNNLKRFAREARIKLIDQVGRKLEFVLSNTDPVFIDTNASQIQSLKNKIQAQGKENVIDTVAYTWFNRLMALRFMDANGYTTPKVVTPVVGKSPEILQNALSGQIDENLKINRQRLNDLLDGKLVIADAQTEAYKMLLIASCNQWHAAMPFMFERISDYTELLLPDDLLSENSIITDIRNGMSDEDCGQEELIGWLYQFYIADKKDDVFEGLKKNIKITAENIPAATQLFTPRWIVRYMVENTLGKLWLSLRPNSKLRDHMPYYIEAPEGNEPAPIPEDLKTNNQQLATKITFLDPCQGSGHVLVYAFDLFTKIYEEEGYNTNEIPALILGHNIFGIDIDERAAQLAAFALTMKARSYFPRFLRKPTQPNVIALENVNEETIRQSIKLPITINGNKISDHKELSLNLLTQADNFGSLIQIAPEEANALQINEGSIWMGQQQKLKEQAEYLSRQYHCVVTNPPYMGSKGMNSSLRLFVESKYSNSKSDLMACFIERCLGFNVFKGKSGLINQHSWMFLSTFQSLRESLLNNIYIESLLHLGPRTFPEISGEVVQSVAFVLCNSLSEQNNSVFIRLVDLKDTKQKEINIQNTNRYFFKRQIDIIKVPGNSIAYWVSNQIISIFENAKPLKEVADIRSGISTGDNDRFYRFWHEVSDNKVEYCGTENLTDTENNFLSDKKWIPIIKGGTSINWYGNQESVINLENNAYEIKNAGNNFRLRTTNFYFKEGISWSRISSNNIAFRAKNIEVTFGENSPSLFIDSSKYYQLLGLLNSKIPNLFLSLINPTLTFQVIDVEKIPIIETSLEDSLIVENVKKCLLAAKSIWDIKEDYWAYQPIEINNFKFVNQAIQSQSTLIHQHLLDIKINEEIINKFFIEQYNLNGDLSPEVDIKKLIYFYNEAKIENDKIIIEHSPLLLLFLNYSTGNLFGRYSLDKSGLILANQGDTLQDFLKQIPNPSFMPDEDNIIPVLEGEWFNDDIVGRFKVFLKAAFGEEHFEENLQYIEDTIGKDIRKYFVKDFYNDHIKRYKKRPIYWMFSSPKGHFKALIYMHRYTSDLCSKMLTDYLQSYINKLEAAQQNKIAESLREDLPARDRTAATKEADRFAVMIKDCKEYAQTLYAVATKKITIDLDDGVKVNYQKFKEVLVPIKGLEKDEE